jgi:hypothetical protein
MKKTIATVLAVSCLSLPALAGAYTINDLDNDAKPYNSETFETYGITVWNYTPGENNGLIYFGLYTDLPETKAGEVADLFVYEKCYGNEYLWAMPLVNHDNFIAGDFYAVESYKTAADFGSGLDQNIPVRIESLGSNYDHTHITSSGVFWIPNDGVD